MKAKWIGMGGWNDKNTALKMILTAFRSGSRHNYQANISKVWCGASIWYWSWIFKVLKMRKSKANIAWQKPNQSTYCWEHKTKAILNYFQLVPIFQLLTIPRNWIIRVPFNNKSVKWYGVSNKKSPYFNMTAPKKGWYKSHACTKTLKLFY